MKFREWLRNCQSGETATIGNYTIEVISKAPDGSVTFMINGSQVWISHKTWDSDLTLLNLFYSIVDAEID